MADIKPGSKINIKVVKTPNTSAGKTIQRLFNRDPENKEEQKRLERVRAANYNPTPRGGRLYGGRVPKIHVVDPRIGAEATIVASVDILNDIASVERFVEVSPA